MDREKMTKTALEKIELKIHPKRSALILEICGIVLSLISFFLQLAIYDFDSKKAAWWSPLFSLDIELSVPSLYQVFLFFIIAFLFFLISYLKIVGKEHFRWHWFFVSCIALILAFDEGASIHELATMPIRHLMGGNLPGFLRFAWVIPALVVVIVLVFLFWKFFRSLPGRTQILLFISIVAYLSGALGLEMIGSNYAVLNGIKNLTYNIFVTFEETFEMTGLVLANFTLLDYLQNNYPQVAVRIR
jgi:hypothetical protein